MANARVLRLSPLDNVVIAVDPIAAAQPTDAGTAGEPIPRGHKMATQPIAQGEPIRKFGQIIGFAHHDIAPGAHVHTHNCDFGAFARDYAISADLPEPVSEVPTATFQGYRRASGRAGTRNYIGVLTSVNCSGSVARFMAQAVERSGILAEFPNVDGIIPLVHGTGCAMDLKGPGHELLKRTQWGYAAHPNMGGVIMVGLGCEVFQIRPWMEAYGLSESDTFRSFTIQAMGGTRRTIEAGVAAIRDMLPAVDRARRQTIAASELTLALQCGGSDGYSGITANPALGMAVDLLVAQGGTAILSETPEIYGAEHLLTRRAASPDIARKLLDLIAWWEDYAARNGGSMDNNPSPGNKSGGLTTILEKSLGAVAKGGTTALRGVYHYAEPVDAKGLVFMDTPGYDPVSATGQVAGGANVLCFTTGRGSAYGCKPTPSLKLATNSEMYRHMAEDMDIDCGNILDGVSLADKGREIFEAVLRVASGERTKSEQLGYGDVEFVPWQVGATM